MKKYIAPEIDIVELDKTDITGVSPKEYRESKVFRAVCEPSPKK